MIRYLVHIECDICERTSERIDGSSTSAEEAVNHAVAYGWRADLDRRYDDICPGCLFERGTPTTYHGGPR